MSVDRSIRQASDELRGELVRAAEREHRLHQRAAAERAAAERWSERQAMAIGRGLAELAARAGEQVELHLARAARLEDGYEEQRRYVERLREAVRVPGLVLSRPPAVEVTDPINRLSAWEGEAKLEQDLQRLKARRAARHPPTERVD